MSRFYVDYWSREWIDENHFPEVELESFQQHYTHRDLGVAFSGGGTRSAACTLGQLKALDELGLLPRVKYISAVSGGGWAATPFTYTDDTELYFGEIRDPENITFSNSKSVHSRSMQSAISDSPLVSNLIVGGLKLKGDESFAYSLGEVFLKPYGLHDPSRYFTFDQESEVLTRQGFPSSTKLDFYHVRKGAPYLILGATLLNEDGLASDKKYHVEYTPFYSGVRVGHVDKDLWSSNDYFGGGYITSCGYDCKGPYSKRDLDGREQLLVKQAPVLSFDITNEKAFSLNDIIASTGAAPQEITSNIGLGALGFPEFNHMPLNPEEGDNSVSEEYPHSDGGHLENLGIMPLLARKMTKIVVFVNTKKPFSPNMKKPLDSGFNKSVQALFVPIDNLFKKEDFSTNVVFNNGEEELIKLIEQLSQLVKKESSSDEYIAKTALFAKTKLVTTNNEHYGIEAGHEVEITWVYNCRSSAWERKLKDKDLAKLITKKKRLIGNQEGLEDFPHYGTFFENPRGVVELTKVQTNLLTNLSYWVAKKALDEV
ncbi:patatin-like phospholipase family protein [Agarivorans aestuarii]|uniref:patatin-like phospholipase family protein n=1 Tax=Agarivorans aestuarii TaxID=1563703 RepID=UPI001C81A79C|nr:patatin-like phospholipase family protein [Agarivorans aestuarii]